MHSKFIILSGLETPEVDATIIILVIDLIYMVGVPKHWKKKW